MNRPIPTMNKILSRKWDQKMQMEHRERLAQLSSRLDNKSPSTFRHVEVKQKRLQLQEGKLVAAASECITSSLERYSEIEKCNKILMQKMTGIIQNKETFCKSISITHLTLIPQTEQRNLIGLNSVSPRGKFFSSRNRLDNKKSLNFDKRLRDHKNIIMQNEAMLYRLQNKKSNFNVGKWERVENQR